MNLATLILYVCLANGTGQDCKEIDLILDGMTEQNCLMAGEVKAIEWLDSHPGYRLVAVTCQWGVGERKT